MDAMDVMQSARSTLRAGDVESAIALAGSALEMMLNRKADDDDDDDAASAAALDVARAHATYGEALFRGAQATNTVFGETVRENAEASGTRLDDDRDDDDDDGDDEDAAADEEDIEEDDEDTKAATTTRAEGAADENKGEVDDEEDDEEEGGGGEEEADEADEESDMELAWKMLETARVMYEESGEAPLELADVLETIGELNMEQSQFEVAVKDYHAALELCEANLDPTDRRLASVLYCMSMAYQMLELNDEALGASTRAFQICQARIKDLKAGTALVSRGARENAGQPMSPEGTIEELQQIIVVSGALEERQEELKELVSADNSTREALRAAFKAIGGAAPEPSSKAEESAGFAAPQLLSSLPVQAAPVRKVAPAPVRKVEVAPLREAPVKRVDPQQVSEPAVQPEAKKLKPTPVENASTEPAKEGEPNGCAQQ
jgi:nuclear autoantigenic sperm protein